VPPRLVLVTIPNLQLPTPKANHSAVLGEKPAKKLVAALCAQLSRIAGVGSWDLVIGSCLAALLLVANAAVSQPSSARTIAWNDIAPLRDRLQRQGLAAATFDEYIQRLHQENLRRVREGDLDHLVFYFLQSTRLTGEAPIEPALSAKALVDSLDANEREAFLRAATAPSSRIPQPVQARVAAFRRAMESPPADPRLRYFAQLVNTSFPDVRQRDAALLREYLRVMRFVYQKEFVAQKAEQAPAAIAELYRTRGLSTDTAVEAGYLVYQGLGVVKALEPERRIRRVLIVGPGLDLAPRTALVEEGPPESYQPWAVMDALVALGLARLDDLAVVGADINPRVVDHLRRARREPPTLTLVSEIRDSETVTVSEEYKDYFAQLGRAIGSGGPGQGAVEKTAAGQLRKTVRVRADAALVLSAASLDIVTERSSEPPFDLIIATNILPYFDDTQLTLAMTNVAAMLAPSGVFLHNEARPMLGDVMAALGVPFEQSRHATIATVRGATAPLFDSMWIHRRK
jgi:hypothetical protein